MEKQVRVRYKHKTTLLLDDTTNEIVQAYMARHGVKLAAAVRALIRQADRAAHVQVGGLAPHVGIRKRG